MRYADTSLLLSLFLRDSGTPAALAWLEEAGTDALMASQWSLTEFAGATADKVRNGKISPELQRTVMVRFFHFAAMRLTLELPEAADFEFAAELIGRSKAGLRAGEALHLAICSRRGSTFCTADTSFSKIAELLNIKTNLVG